VTVRVGRAARPQILTALAASAVLALTLSACGRSSAPQTSAVSSTIDNSPATGTVTLWAPDGDAAALKTVLKPFQQANPKIDLKITLIASDQYNTKLQTAIAGGTTPDIAQLYTETERQFLTPRIFAPMPTGLVDPSTFFTSSWNSGVINGTAYAVPWYTYSYAFIYRKDLATKAGVSAPTKLSEMVPFFTALQSAGANKGFSADVGWDSYTGQDLTIYTWQEGGDVMNADQTKWTFANNPAFLAAMKQFASYFSSGTSSTDGPQFVDSLASFVSGKTASIVSGPWTISALDAVAKQQGWTAANVGVVPLPAGTANAVSNVGGGSWGVFRTSKNSTAAWKVIRYLSRQDTQIAQYKALGSMPSVVSAWQDSSISGQPLLKPFFTDLKNSRSFPAVSTWSQVATEMGKDFEAVARGTESPEAAIKKIQSFADSVGTGTN
jgi:multiple sugar transport system substrate-binding protein